jgi:hypothetical protein
MVIKVIEQSTSERKRETRELFESIRPLLDKGYSYMTACVMVGRCKDSLKNNYYSNGWFRDLKEYGKKNGYHYKDFSGKKRR